MQGHRAAVDVAGGRWAVVPGWSAAGLVLIATAVRGERERVQVDFTSVVVPQRDGDRKCRRLLTEAMPCNAMFGHRE